MQTVGGVIVFNRPISAYHLMMLYFYAKICENISKGFRVIEWTHYAYRNLKRGIIM